MPSGTKSIRKTNLPNVIRILFLLALPLAIFSSGSAASLEGKVMDVVDGEDITVLSLSHLVKVKLVAVASPDRNQSFAHVARQHLADLILNKYVVVRYSGLRDGYIVGQVLLENIDVGAQMLRDGAGWYNKSDETLLGELERQVYQSSQDAARNERRGLWQEDSPVSPWDYRKSQLAPAHPSTKSATVPTYDTSLEHLPRPTPAARRGTESGLSNAELLSGFIGPGVIAGKPDVRQLSSDGAPGKWLRYQPADKHFSILVPSDGLEISVPVLDSRGQTTDLHYVSGNKGPTAYLVMWAKGPNGTSTDDSAADDAIRGILDGFNHATEQSGGFVVTATPDRRLKLSGHTGRQYALNLGPVSGVVRVLSKQTRDQRELFLLCVMSAVEGEPSGTDFFNSFKVE
ncbi:MAG: thermonuclease family protein [Pyrinomonadaceae bacterium]